MTKDQEIDRLRAEVERLKRIDAANDLVAGVLERERDEALAQVAVLVQFVESHTSHLLVSPLALKDIPAEARALLDRLQRAEAVVEALAKHGADSEECFQALAVWEEGTA